MVISWDHPAAIELRRKIVEGIVENSKKEGMYRVHWPDGKISDMVNKTRAKDAIRVFEEREAKSKSTMPSQAPTEARGEFNEGES